MGASGFVLLNTKMLSMYERINIHRHGKKKYINS